MGRNYCTLAVMNAECKMSVLVALVLTLLNAGPSSGESLPSVSVDDSIGRIQIPLISLAPGGQYVAYLTVQGLPRENSYEITARLVATSGTASPLMLARYRLNPEDVFDANTGGIEKAAGQFAWSPEGRDLAYTRHVASGVQVRIRNSRTGVERVLLTNANRIEIEASKGGLELRAAGAVPSNRGPRKYPSDYSLLIKDGYRFYQPPLNAKTRCQTVLELWKYSWRARRVLRLNLSGKPGSPDLQREWEPGNTTGKFVIKNTRDVYASYSNATPSPDRMLLAAVEDSRISSGNVPGSQRTSRVVLERLNDTEPSPTILIPSEMPRVVYTILGWSPDSKQIYYAGVTPQYSFVSAVGVDGRAHLLYKEASGFSFPTPASELSRDCETIVFVRSTNVIPDELVKIDLQSGFEVVLSRPNVRFKSRLLPTVRFLAIECCGGRFYGRLFLPPDYGKGKPYPLVFTNYVSTPGFYASVGDEVPILAMTAHGIAVFTMSSSEANILSSTRDFSSEISRVQQPVAAMEWVRQRLSDEGVIDPSRCGLTGLSYGAEIAMYAYWRSRAFRVISVASASWEPMNYVLGGVSYSKYLDSRGFDPPGPESYANWKEISAGLNARPNLPPLLVQSSDGEEYFGTVEAWTRLRRAGAPVEWFEYPGEGHVKRFPANKWWVYERNLDWFCFWLKDEIHLDPATSDQYARWREMQKNLGTVPAKAESY